MLYLDYAKPLADGKYILNFFADSAADLESISHGQKFVTKNGTDYGVPQAGSTVIVTSPNSGKTTYVIDAEGIWVVTEDISYSAVVANPSDAATAKLEKLKVNDTTYANWTENEIKQIASEAGGGKLYLHHIKIMAYLEEGSGVLFDGMISIDMYSSSATKFTLNTFIHDDLYYYYTGVVNDNQSGKIGTACIRFNGEYIFTYGATIVNNNTVTLHYEIPYGNTQVADTVTEV